MSSLLGTVPFGPNSWKVYLIGFNSQVIRRDELTGYLEQSPLFENWMSLLPGQVFAVSAYQLYEVSSSLRERFSGQFLFVAEVNQMTCDGWMPKDIWEFINNPKPSYSVASPSNLSAIYQALQGSDKKT